MTTSEDRLLRRAEVQRRCGLARSSIYRLMRAGEFPEPLKVGVRGVRWSEAEITAWVETRKRATGAGHRG